MEEEHEDVDAITAAVKDACLELDQPPNVVMYGLVIALTDLFAAMVANGYLDREGVEEIVRRGLIEWVDAKAEDMRGQPH